MAEAINGLTDEDVFGAPPAQGQAPRGMTDEEVFGSAVAAPTGSPSWGSVGQQFVTGAEKVPYAAAAAIPEATNWMANRLRGVLGMPQRQEAPLGYGQLTRWAGQIHPALNPENYPARNLPERMAQGAGMGAGAAVALPALAETTGASAYPLVRSLIGAPSAAAVPSAAAAGAGSQAGGESGANLVSPQEHPVASALLGTLGSMAGGVGLGGLANAPAALAKASPARQALVTAGQNIGAVPPRYMVGNPVTQATGELMHSIPVAGTPIDVANQKFLANLGRAASGEAANLGQGEPLEAGRAMQAGIRNWIGPVSTGNVKSAYDKVDSLLTNPTAITPLTNANTKLADLFARRATYGDTPVGKALDLIQNANDLGRVAYYDRLGGKPYYNPLPGVDYAATPGSVPYAVKEPGLTYEGMKRLRTEVGQLLSPSILTGTTQEAERKQIYGALSDDRMQAALNSGGPEAVAALRQADVLNRATQIRRAELTKILGSKDPNADRPEAVYAALRRASGLSETASANIGLLQKAKASVSPQDWNELASGVISTLGQDPKTGEFSGNRFMSDYGRMSPEAKDALFGTPGMASTRDNLDSIQALSGVASGVRSKYGNPSGTGHVVAAIELIRSVFDAVKESGSLGRAATSLVGIAGTVGGGRVLANFMATPAGSGAVANFARNYAAWMRQPTEETLRQMRFASARVSSAMAAQYGARVPPGAFVDAAMNQPPAAEAGQNDQNVQAPGNQPPDHSQPKQ